METTSKSTSTRTQESAETQELRSSSSHTDEFSAPVKLRSRSSKEDSEEIAMTEISSSASVKLESSVPVGSPLETSKDGEERDITEMPSTASSKGESSFPVASPPGTSKDGEEIITEMPSLASSKGESSFPVESPPGTSKDGEEIDITEMPSTASSKGESSTSVESPPGTSKDSDKIDILSSKTATPEASALISTGHPIKSPEETGSKCFCSSCCDFCDGCCEKFIDWCETRQWKNMAIFGVGFVGFIVGLRLQENEVNFSLEVLCTSILLMYCGLFACLFNRGCCFKTTSPVHPRRRKILSPAEESEGEKSIKGAVPVAMKTDTPKREMNVVIDVYRALHGELCM